MGTLGQRVAGARRCCCHSCRYNEPAIIRRMRGLTSKRPARQPAPRRPARVGSRQRRCMRWPSARGRQRATGSARRRRRPARAAAALSCSSRRPSSTRSQVAATRRSRRQRASRHCASCRGSGLLAQARRAARPRARRRARADARSSQANSVAVRRRQGVQQLVVFGASSASHSSLRCSSSQHGAVVPAGAVPGALAARPRRTRVAAGLAGALGAPRWRADRRPQRLQLARRAVAPRCARSRPAAGASARRRAAALHSGLALASMRARPSARAEVAALARRLDRAGATAARPARRSARRPRRRAARTKLSGSCSGGRNRNRTRAHVAGMRQARLERRARGAPAGGVAVEAEDHRVGEAKQLLHMLGGAGRAERGHGIGEARLRQRDHVHVALDDQRVAALAQRRARLEQAVQFAALD